MEPYEGPTKRTFRVILISSVLLPLGYFGIFYLQVINGPLKTFESKFSQDNRKKICQWTEEQTYLSCMRKDFYALIRSTGPYQSQLAHQFITDVFRYDRDQQVSDKGKINSYLDYIDLSLNFLEIERRARLNRKKLNVPGIIMAKINKNQVIEEVKHFSSYFQKLEGKYKMALESDELLVSRYQRLKKSYERLSPSLK